MSLSAEEDGRRIMMTRRIVVLLGLLFLAALLVAGCRSANVAPEAESPDEPAAGEQDEGEPQETETEEEEEEQQEEAGEEQSGEEVALVIADIETAESMTPNVLDHYGNHHPHSSIFSGLVVMDWGVTQGTSAYGDLAEDWEVSDDGTTITFNLREDALWHDGEPVTSADVKYTYETIIANEYPLYSAVLHNVEEIRAPDDHTVIIELKEPDLAFVPTLAQNSIWFGKIVPSHLYVGTEWESDWTLRAVDEEPIGSGPFKFAEWEIGSTVILEANEDYFLGPPEVDTLVFQHTPDSNVAVSLFQAGDIPYLISQHVPAFGEIAAMLDNPEQADQVVKTPSIFNRDLYINLDHEVLGELEVRQALGHAIDRDQINQLAFLGLWNPVPGAGVASLGEFNNEDALYPAFDPEQAEALLDEAGYPRGDDGWRFSLELTHPPIADTALIAEVLVQQLQNVGIQVDWEQPDWAAWQEALEARNYDITIYYTRYGPDPNSYWEHFATDGQVNFTGYSNPELDTLLEEAKKETNHDARVDMYHQAQEILIQDLPQIAMFQQVRFSLVNPAWDCFPVQECGFNKSMTWFGFYAVEPPQE